MNKKYTDVNLIKSIQRAGRDLKLDDKTKAEMHQEIMAVIKSDVMRIEQGASPKYSFNPRRFTMPILPVLIAALITIGGGTAVYADQAVPGDTLYPVGQLVETIQDRLTFSVEARAALFARLSEERAAELVVLLTDEKKAQRAQSIKDEAISRLALSIEKTEALRYVFEAKLHAAETDGEKAAFQRVLDRIDEITARRELRIEALVSGEKISSQGQLRARLHNWLKDNDGEVGDIYVDLAAKYGVVLPTIAPYPYPPRVEFKVSEGWTKLQEELRERRAKFAQEIAEKFANGEIEIRLPEDSVLQPVPLSNDDDSRDDRLTPDGYADEVEVKGSISAISANSITVDGKTFAINSHTTWRSDAGLVAGLASLVVGNTVEVEADLVNGVWTARRVQTEDSV